MIYGHVNKSTTHIDHGLIRRQTPVFVSDKTTRQQRSCWLFEILARFWRSMPREFSGMPSWSSRAHLAHLTHAQSRREKSWKSSQRGWFFVLFGNRDNNSRTAFRARSRSWLLCDNKTESVVLKLSQERIKRSEVKRQELLEPKPGKRTCAKFRKRVKCSWDNGGRNMRVRCGTAVKWGISGKW